LVQRNRTVKRSREVHGKELNRLLYAYVYLCNGKSKKQIKAIETEKHSEWVEYCYKHRKHKIVAPNPEGFKLLIKNKEAIESAQKALGIYNPPKAFIVFRLIKKLFTK